MKIRRPGEGSASHPSSCENMLVGSQSAAVLAAASSAGILDQDAPHRLGSRGEEVAATVPTHLRIVADQTQVGFVDQGGSVERLSGFFVRELVSGQSAQLVVDQRQELLGRLRIALLKGVQNLRDGRHNPQDSRAADDEQEAGFEQSAKKLSNYS